MELDISELDRIITLEKNKYKVYEKADVALTQLKALKQAETDLTRKVDALSKDVAELVEAKGIKGAITEGTKKVAALEKEITAMEDAVKKHIDRVAKAKDEAASMLGDAETKSEAIVRAAQRKCDEMLADANESVNNLTVGVSSLENEHARLKAARDAAEVEYNKFAKMLADKKAEIIRLVGD